MRVDNEVIVPVRDPSHPLQRVRFTVEGGGSANPVVVVSDANTDEEIKRIPIVSDESIEADISALENRVTAIEPYSNCVKNDWYIARYVSNLNSFWHPGLFNWRPDTVGLPVSGTYGMGICIANTREDTEGNWAYQIGKTTVDTSEVWVRQSINTGGWTAWRKIGQHDTGWLKLAGTYDTPVGHDGTNGLYYRKTGSMVTVLINAGSSWGPTATTSGVLLGTLPVGYRPDTLTIFPVAHKGTTIIIKVEVLSNGQIRAISQSGSTNYYAGTLVFPV